MKRMKRDSRVLLIIIPWLAVGALLIFMVFNVYTISRTWNYVMTHSITIITKSQDTSNSSVPQPIIGHDPKTERITAKDISCNRAHNFYDICSIKGPTLLDPTISTFFQIDPINSTPQKPLVEKVRPYARKWENVIMSRIKEVSLVSGQPTTKSCQVQHKAPALVFSAGGYTGNFFHDFNDGFIPLYITLNTIYPDQEIVLVISMARDWWVSKYSQLLRAFSNYPVVNLDNDTSTHCFPSASVGMISHGFMTIDPKLIPNSKTFTHFRAFLHKAYGQNQNHLSVSTPEKHSLDRPLLVLLVRSGRRIGRLLLNQKEVKLEAEKVGFNVVVFKPSSRTALREAYGLVNSSHAMVGIHGAALTHSLFMRPGSVLGQVVPLGAEWVSRVCFEISARAMGVEYMEYRIKAEESSLMEKYSKDEEILKDPVAFRGKNWSPEIMNIYLKEQNVRLDLIRFREYLKEVYVKAKLFMDQEGSWLRTGIGSYSDS